MAKLARGILIAVEGIDGAGKSTLAQGLKVRFDKKNIETLLTREPGGSELGKSLREILQHQKKQLDPIAEFLLFAADRAQHFKEIIIPALNQTTLVISDRLSDSSLVYQGFGKGVDSTMIEKVNAWAMHKIKPDLTVYMHIDPKTARERLETRGKKLTSFEKEAADFTDRLIVGFDTLYRNGKNVIIVEGTMPADELASSTFNVINEWLLFNQLMVD